MLNKKIILFISIFISFVLFTNVSLAQTYKSEGKITEEVEFVFTYDIPVDYIILVQYRLQGTKEWQVAKQVSLGITQNPDGKETAKGKNIPLDMGITEAETYEFRMVGSAGDIYQCGKTNQDCIESNYLTLTVLEEQEVCNPGELKTETDCLVCNTEGTDYLQDHSKCESDEYCAGEGSCESTTAIGENKKDINKYSNKEVFLISDKNWRDVLSLVPITIWTEGNQVKKNPTLIWHEESSLLNIKIGDLLGKSLLNIPNEAWQSFISEDDFISKVIILGGEIGQTYFIQLQDSKGNVIANSESYIVDSYYQKHDFVFNTPINKGELYKLVWKIEDDDDIAFGASNKNPYPNGEYSEISNFDIEMQIFGDDPIRTFDADSLIYFMQQYDAQKVTIIGETPQELDNLLIVEPELGAGLSQGQIERISVNDYLSYWESFDTVVYVEDNYELALMASTYASLIDAPLIIKGTNLDSDNVFVNRNVILVGSLGCPDKANCNSFTTIEDLQKEYIRLTNTDKVMLVNPNDLDIKVIEEFTPEKSSNSINELYGKTSLAAPLLAAGKQEVIIFADIEESPPKIDCNSLPIIMDKIDEVDKIVTKNVENLFTGSPEYLTIMANPLAIPQAFSESCKIGGMWDVTFKDAVDKVYARSLNHNRETKWVIDNDAFDIALDSKNNVHIVWAEKINERKFLLYKVYNKEINEWEKTRILGEGGHPIRITIDSQDNLHLVYRIIDFSDPSSPWYTIYKKIDTNRNIIIDKVISELKVWSIDLDADLNNNIHIVLESESNTADGFEIHYIKIDDIGEIEINKKIYGPTGVHSIIQSKLITDSNGAVHIVFNSRNIDLHSYVYYIKIDNKGEIVDNNKILSSEKYGTFKPEIISTSDDEIIILIITYEKRESVLKIYKDDEWKTIPIEYENFLESINDIAIDADNNIHLVGSSYYYLDKYNDGIPAPYYQKINIEGDTLTDLELIQDETNEVYWASDSPRLDLDSSGNPHIIWFAPTRVAVIDNGQIKKWNRIEFPELYYKDKYEKWGESQKVIGLEMSKDFYMHVGRIYGLTLSDASSYIARAVFYNDLFNNVYAGMSIAHSFEYAEESAAYVTEKMSASNYDWTCFTETEQKSCVQNVKPPYDDYENKQIITFQDHGSSVGWAQTLHSDTIPWLDLSFSFGDACATNDFDIGKSNTFGVRFLRRGGIGYIGASGLSWAWHKNIYSEESNEDIIITQSYLTLKYLAQKEKISLGELFSKLSEDSKVINTDYLLYGDPTLKLNTKEVVLE